MTPFPHQTQRTIDALRVLGFEIDFQRFTVLLGEREVPVEAVADLGLPWHLRRDHGPRACGAGEGKRRGAP